MDSSVMDWGQARRLSYGIYILKEFVDPAEPAQKRPG
jgi:hypothetical protein